MATPQQIQANRANARRSTGPRTPEGKAASASNALKHGLRAQRTILPDENIEEFQALLSQYEQDFQPATAVERTLVQQLADAAWRLHRIPRFEAAVLGNEIDTARRHAERYPDPLPADPAVAETCLLGQAVLADARNSDVLTKLSRYETRLSQRYFKTLDHLYRAQERRHRSKAPSPSVVETKPNQTNPISTPPGPRNGSGTTAPDPAETQSGQTNPIPAASPAGETTHLPAATPIAARSGNQTQHEASMTERRHPSL